MNRLTRHAIFVLLPVVLVGVPSCRTLGPEAAKATAFATPQTAGEALTTALQAGDHQALSEILGGDSESLLSSGDPVADRLEAAQFVTAYEFEHSWVRPRERRAVLEIGEKDWPFPIPLVEGAEGWRFDTAQGAEEILNRRVGRNELDTIQSCLAFVDAEREYYQTNPRESEVPEYARFILSSAGQKDGLYWETFGDQAPSPLGGAYAAARSQNYSPTQGGGKPYHGYLYRVLHAQGPSAPGGAYDYIEGDQMTRGFALLAWPVNYGASGVMTFLISHVGVMYQKDLGAETATAVKALEAFNPDQTWPIVSADAQELTRL